MTTLLLAFQWKTLRWRPKSPKRWKRLFFFLFPLKARGDQSFPVKVLGLVSAYSQRGIPPSLTKKETYSIAFFSLNLFPANPGGVLSTSLLTTARQFSRFQPSPETICHVSSFLHLSRKPNSVNLFSTFFCLRFCTCLSAIFLGYQTVSFFSGDVK